MPDWRAIRDRAEERWEDGRERLPDEPEPRQRQLTRIGNAAYATGLAALMEGETDDARDWLARAAEAYRESFAGAPPDSWGRPIGAMKARLIANDSDAAVDDARWALDAGAAKAGSPIGRYAAALALLVLGRDHEARVLADDLRIHDGFPTDVGDALAYLAAGTDAVGYIEAIESVLASFEARDEYLEDVPVADTVLALQALARPRGLEVELTSPLLP
ncbi:MAG TPA: hypothetical protein VFU10_12435 [Gaiellaceae bacterium]|nr:hypothetical protein [Gaiellaceae bacterium]